ncbi:hypothetical protein JXA40_08465 [bacterium]|nr:hypothetical protein [candidate division CSSED10-310 bacterium]
MKKNEPNASSKSVPADSARKKADGSAPQGIIPPTGNIDKIRDILFGAQMQDYEKRFNRLESRLVKELADLREDTRKRFDALEEFANKEIDNLASRLKSEQTERMDSEKDIIKDHKEDHKSIEKKIAVLDEESNKERRDLRQQILDLNKSLSNEIESKTEEMTRLLEQIAGELRLDKVDRSALSNLFTELALRLHNESALELNLETSTADEE